MTFIGAVKTCFLKYTDFSGRAIRSEFWLFTLFTTLASVCADVVDAALIGQTYWSYDGFYGPVQSVLSILFFLPSLAVSVRRLHDIGKSGWWVLFSFTGVGIIVLLYWTFRVSEEGTNSYGKSLLAEFGEGIHKNVSRWIKFGLVPIFAFLMVPVLLLISGVILEARVYKGTELSDTHKNSLINHNLIDPADRVLFFYSDGLFSIIESGQLVTERKLVSYLKNEDGILEKYEMLLEDVKKIELLEEGDAWSDSFYKIVGGDNSDYEYITIPLSVEAGGDQDFIDAIKKGMK